MKIRIGVIKKLDSSTFSLKYKGKALDENKKISTYHIADTSRITIVLKDPPIKKAPNITLKAMFMTGKEITVEISPDDMVEDLKDKIACVENLYPKRLRLLKEDKPLEPSKLIKNCHLKNMNTINVIISANVLE